MSLVSYSELTEYLHREMQVSLIRIFQRLFHAKSLREAKAQRKGIFFAYLPLLAFAITFRNTIKYCRLKILLRGNNLFRLTWRLCMKYYNSTTLPLSFRFQ